MPTLFFLFLAIVAGSLIPVQAGLNYKLGEAVKSPVYGALLSFVIGTLGLFLYTLGNKTEFANLKNVTQLPWYYFTGGLMGALFVFTMIVAPPRLGMALTLGITVAAQMAFGLLMDHYGWLGMASSPINWEKVLGVLLIIGGVFLLRN